MQVAAISAFLLVLVSYGAATLSYIRVFTRSQEGRRDLGSIFSIIGMLCQAAYLVSLGVLYRELPLVGMVNVCAFLSLSLVLVHSVVEFRSKARGTGAFICGLATILHLLSWPSVFMDPVVQDFLRSPLFALHVLFAIAGYTGFVLSALYGVMYLLQFRALKSMRFGPLFKSLPALNHLATMNFESALVGFICLSVGLLLGTVLGAAYKAELAGSILTDAKFVQAAAAWLCYALLVSGRFRFGWSGRQLVYYSLASFGLLLGSLMIVSIFFDTFHRFS